MSVTEQQNHEFIDDALYHELRCLLGAATVWRVFMAQAAGFDVTVAMDSAFVHARNLYRFFTNDATGDGDDIRVEVFGPVTPYRSTTYEKWKRPLHRHVLHIGYARMNPKNVRGGVHLNEQVEVFARDILKLWRKLENDSDALTFRASFASARERAIQDAAHDASGRVEPLFQ